MGYDGRWRGIDESTLMINAGFALMNMQNLHAYLLERLEK